VDSYEASPHGDHLLIRWVIDVKHQRGQDDTLTGPNRARHPAAGQTHRTITGQVKIVARQGMSTPVRLLAMLAG
jgi:hypothetical protein